MQPSLGFDVRKAYAFLPLPGIAAWSAADADSLVGAGGKRGWMHVFVSGDWKGHPAGPFELTGATFDRMIERFESRKTALSVDYDHSLPERGDSRAAGWIRKLEKRQTNDGYELWAEVEWTPAAARMISDGEYRNCSGFFSLGGGTDPVTGEEIGPELINVGLTNNPFIDGLTPIRLSRGKSKDTAMPGLVMLAAPPPPPPPKEEPVAQDDAPPPPPPAADPAAQPAITPPTPENDQATLLNQMITSAVDQMCKTAGADRPAVIEMLVAMADKIGGDMRELKERDQTSAEERDMADAAKPKDEKPAPTAASKPETDEARIAAAAIQQAEVTNERLLSRIEALEANEKARETKAAADIAAGNVKTIAKMFALGKLREDQRELATWMLNTHPEKFEKIYGSLEGLDKPVPIGVTHAGSEQRATSRAPGGTEFPAEIAGNQYDEGVYAFCKKQGWSDERALARTLANRNTQAARSGAKVG